METIRNYLETMFSTLPNTPEVLRARNELWQMMEDKYNHLKSEGKSENEAIGIVIAEFGNLEELAEDLGIHNIVKETPLASLRKIPLEQAKAFLHDETSHSFCVALGVLLFIISPLGAIVTSETGLSALGILFLFLCIAAGVFLLVFSAIRMLKWDFLRKEPCTIDFATTNYIHEAKERYRSTFALLLTLGIVLCILSVVPAAIMDELNLKTFWIKRYNIDAMLLLLMVGIGVFMIILTGCVNSSFGQLLRLNDGSTVSGHYVSSQHSRPAYISSFAEVVMSVYWSTVTCIYLCWSFLSFDWHITWIIWPLAAVIHAPLNIILKKEREDRQ